MTLLETLSWGLSGVFLSESARSGSFCWPVRPQLSPERGGCDCSSLLASHCCIWLVDEVVQGSAASERDHIHNSPQGPLPRKNTEIQIAILPYPASEQYLEVSREVDDPAPKILPSAHFSLPSLSSIWKDSEV